MSHDHEHALTSGPLFERRTAASSKVTMGSVGEGGGDAADAAGPSAARVKLRTLWRDHRPCRGLADRQHLDLEPVVAHPLDVAVRAAAFPCQLERPRGRR